MNNAQPVIAAPAALLAAEIAALTHARECITDRCTVDQVRGRIDDLLVSRRADLRQILSGAMDEAAAEQSAPRSAAA